MICTVTSIMNTDGLTEGQSHSWARAMQHSVRCQREIYDRSSGEKRVAPACDMAASLFKTAAKRRKTTATAVKRRKTTA